MDANTTKRRKLGHGGSFLPTGTAATPAASAFADATEELLLDAQVDYAQTFEGVDAILRQLKESVEAIEAHEPTPVSPTCICDSFLSRPC